MHSFKGMLHIDNKQFGTICNNVDETHTHTNTDPKHTNHALMTRQELPFPEKDNIPFMGKLKHPFFGLSSLGYYMPVLVIPGSRYSQPGLASVVLIYWT